MRKSKDPWTKEESLSQLSNILEQLKVELEDSKQTVKESIKAIRDVEKLIRANSERPPFLKRILRLPFNK